MRRTSSALFCALALALGAGVGLAEAAPAAPAPGVVTQGDLIMQAAVAASHTDPAKWDWPPIASPKVRKEIAEGHYSPEELRNIFTILASFSGNRWPTQGPKAQDPSTAKLRAPDAIAHGRGFRGLEVFYGSNGYAGGPDGSIGDRVNNVDTVIAHGDQVLISWIIEGHHTGKLFGFPGDGKPMHVRETSVQRFKDGRAVETNAIGDDLALYTQAGGKISFPDKP
ncbi:MAG TPA: ester cyclase [Caulobacteraceae bacterium]|nr:ester cyclase [Caulobacteraceae bacterium]